MNRRHLRTILLLVLLALLFGQPQAGAGEAPDDAATWGVVPSRKKGEAPRPAFLLDLAPGVDVEDRALVINDGEEPLKIRLYAADGRNLEDGSFALESERESRDHMGAWIELPFTAATVEPGKALVVPFTVRVPANATPGDLSGGIVAIEAEASAVTEENGATLGVVQGIGVRVHGRVTGPATPSIDVLDVDVDVEQSIASLFGLTTKATVTYRIQNTGNVRLSPTVDVKLSGIGPTARAPEEEIVDFLPGSTATITQEVSGVWPTGPKTAEVTVTALDRSDSVEKSTVVAPWLLLAALVAAGLAGGYWRRRRKDRGDGDDNEEEVDPEPEPGPAPTASEERKVLQGLTVVLLLGLVAGLGLAQIDLQTADAADTPTIRAGEQPVAPGDSVGISGEGWPAGELVQVVLCGNVALNGSADCDEQNYSIRAATSEGTFSTKLVLKEPPVPCPCVLKASSDTAGPVLAPIEMKNVDSAKPKAESPVAEAFTGGLEVVDAAVTGSGGVASWFGLASSRELSVTVENTGDAPADATIIARWGKGDDADQVIPSPEQQTVAPGEQTTFDIPFEIDPLAIGSHTVTGELKQIGDSSAFEAETSQWPWGLFVLAAVVVQVLLLAIRNRVRRHIAKRRTIEAAEPDDGKGTPTDDPPSEREYPESEPTIDLRDPVDNGVRSPTNGSQVLLPGELAGGVGPTDASPISLPAVIEEEPIVTPGPELEDESLALNRQAHEALREAKELADSLVSSTTRRVTELLDAAHQDRSEAAALLRRSRASADALLKAAHRQASEIEREMDYRRRSALAAMDAAGAEIDRCIGEVGAHLDEIGDVTDDRENPDFMGSAIHRAVRESLAT